MGKLGKVNGYEGPFEGGHGADFDDAAIIAIDDQRTWSFTCNGVDEGTTTVQPTYATDYPTLNTIPTPQPSFQVLTPTAAPVVAVTTDTPAPVTGGDGGGGDRSSPTTAPSADDGSEKGDDGS